MGHVGISWERSGLELKSNGISSSKMVLEKTIEIGTESTNTVPLVSENGGV
jgi:hypothetical protein